MICPKCASHDVIIATALNRFGSWKCNDCGKSGTYPHEPQEWIIPSQWLLPGSEIVDYYEIAHYQPTTYIMG